MSPFYKNEYLIVDSFVVTRLKTEHLDQALLVLTAQVGFTLILMIFIQMEMLPPGCCH